MNGYHPDNLMPGCTIQGRHERIKYSLKVRPIPHAGNPTTSFLTATTLIYAIGAGITAAAGTRLALQLILDVDSKILSFQKPDPKGPGIVIYCHYLPVSGLAVSQAPSPESNPNPPLPVKATVVQYTTVKADRAET
eukprot:scaffold11636_cov3703-Chaetoceros_neogracile.AAC.1